jgi:hypothetical protein
MSIPPALSPASATHCLISASRARSTLVTPASANPAASASAAVARAVCRLMSEPKTFAPCRANSKAEVLPMPEPAPVTSATLPFNRCDVSACHSGVLDWSLALS